MYFRIIFLISSLVIINTLHGQAERTFSGREFWVTFMENASTPVDTALQLIVTPDTKDTIRIYNPQTGFSKDFEVRPGIQNAISISSAQWFTKRNVLPQNTGIRVRSLRGNVAIQAINAVYSSADITSLLPSVNLENAREYLVNTNAANGSASGQSCIIAMDTGNTTVDIIAGCDLFGLGGKGNTFTKTLKYGQVYLIEALDTQNLAGTIISVKGCKRISVFAGAKCARVQNSIQCLGCDVLYEQMWPINLLQTEYHVPPVPDNKYHRVSISVIFNNTTVDLNGVSYGPFNRGDNFQKEFSSPVFVQADKPVSCAQILKSSGCNGASNALSGDPSLLNIAAKQFETKVAATSCYRHFAYVHTLCFVSQTKSSPAIRVNGITVPAANFQKYLLGGNAFWFGYYAIYTNKTYAITSDSGFIAYQYGSGSSESYASCIGASFKSRTTDFIAYPQPNCNPLEAVNFKAVGDSANSVDWILGDGNFGSGNTTTHIYGSSGNYLVKMLSRNGGNCPDTVKKSIAILNGPKKQFPKDTQPCKGTIFRVELPSQLSYEYLWENGSTSFSQSFIADRKAILITKDTQGCYRTDTLNVVFINCDNYELKLANVFTPGNDGKNDAWKIFYKGYTTINVEISNRWGEIVYKYSLPEDLDWNGKVNNQFTTCPSGVYFYRITASAQNGAVVKHVSGMIQLFQE